MASSASTDEFDFYRNSEETSAEPIAGDKAELGGKGPTSDSLTYRSMVWEDFPVVNSNYHEIWGSNGGAKDKKLAWNLSRHCVLHYLSESTSADMAFSGGEFMGVLCSRIVGQPKLFPQAAEAMEHVEEEIISNPAGKSFLRTIRYWRAVEVTMEEQAGVDDRSQSEIELFLVNERAQGKGVGGGLWKRFYSSMRDHDVNRFYLHTDRNCDFGFYDHKGLRRIISRMSRDHCEDSRNSSNSLPDLYIYEGFVPSEEHGGEQSGHATQRMRQQ